MLGYATSSDGIHWTRDPRNPIYRGHWVEDMMVVKQGDTYYMFAEGQDDYAQLLMSPDKVNWTWLGFLDIRKADGKPISKGPYGTPTAWFENGRWYLLYERGDRAVWLAESKDLKVFTNVQDEPGARPRPGVNMTGNDRLNQVIKYDGRYYACYHGSPGGPRPFPGRATWPCRRISFTGRSIPATRCGRLAENKSSNLLINDGKEFRLYTMHDSVWVFFPAKPAGKGSP